MKTKKKKVSPILEKYSQKHPVEIENFPILLCELRIYLDQIRGSCWQPNQERFGGFYFVHDTVKCVFWWVIKVMKLSLVG